jgi:hypothetical protein
MKRWTLLLAPLLVTAACAPNGVSGNRAGARAVILQEEILDSGARNAFDLVQIRRPQWLRVRGNQSIGNLTEETPTVYFNNTRMGGSDALRAISLASIQSVQFLSPAQANLRWGVGNSHGAIVISTEGF